MMEHPMDMDKEYKKRQEAMRKRLESLGTGNPVVSRAVKQNQPKENTWEKFEIVEELVRAARQGFEADGNFKKCITSLAEALTALANAKGLDNGKSKGDNVSSSVEEGKTEQY